MLAMADQAEAVAADSASEGTWDIQQEELDDKSLDSFVKKANVKRMAPIDAIRYRGQVMFINKTSSRLAVYAVSRKSPAFLSALEGAFKVKDIVELQLRAEWEQVQQGMSGAADVALDFVLEVDGEDQAQLKDVPEGAEGLTFVYLACMQGVLRYCGCDFARCKRKVTFSGLGYATM
jgi:hypothetical protein